MSETDNRQDTKRRIINTVIGAVILVGSAAVLFVLLRSAPRAELRLTDRPPPSVEIMTVEPSAYQAPVIGYGTVRPKLQVNIVPEISGQLTESHPRLAVGNVIEEGELLFTIDARMYESKVAQAKAEISRLQAQLQRHRQTEKDLADQLAIAREQAALAGKNLERERALFAEQSTTGIELEAAQARYFKQQEAVLAYGSQLAAIPSVIEESSALLDIKKAQLAEAQLRVDKSNIFCPFRAKIDRVSARTPQVVVSGAPIAVLTGVEALEIPVAIDPSDLRWMDDDVFAADDWASAREARVTWMSTSNPQTWSARVMRLERLDAVTRSAHIVVEMRNAADDATASEEFAAPSVGMFCRVEIPTTELPGALVVPRSAIHEDQAVYVFEQDSAAADLGQLRMKRVTLLRRVDDEVVVALDSGAAGDDRFLQPGDHLITSPLPNAVDGLPLRLRQAPPAAAADPAGDP